MKPITWKSSKRKLKDLKKWERNPRQATEKQAKDLRKSLNKFNLADPLIINTDNTIIGGHFRYDILLEKFGEKHVVDVRIPSRKLNHKQMVELNLRLNKNQGEWDWELLAQFSEDMLKLTGFENEELDQIFGLTIDENFDVDKELQEAIKKGAQRVKEGDIWQLGDHKLIIADCTNKKAWAKLLGKERFDFLFTDPPYKLAYTKRARKVKTKEGSKLKRDKTYTKVGKTDRKGRFKGHVKTKDGFGYRSQRSYLGVERRGGVPEYDEWLSIANEFQNPKGANVMVFENWRNTRELWDAIEKYWKIRNMIIWHLPNRCQGFSKKYFFFNKYDIAPLATKGKAVKNEGYEKEFDDYLRDKGQRLMDNYEVILYGQQGDSYWDKRKKTRFARINDHITWTAETGKSSGQQIIFGTKPVQILVPFVKILSARTGIVMEPYAGSGSTIIACEIMKRHCRAIEIEPIYAEVILKRWEKFTGKKAKKIGK